MQGKKTNHAEIMRLTALKWKAAAIAERLGCSTVTVYQVRKAAKVRAAHNAEPTLADAPEHELVAVRRLVTRRVPDAEAASYVLAMMGVAA
ncbi:helix-turn-helix domain-containing protein [Agromyces sp. NPDC058104]|uniref:helix-turn-helix domain-containing protein n=1 Tax=Agromyces sp. NPDC058104 TaxID=3346342 RepID=UPI0036DEFFD6